MRLSLRVLLLVAVATAASSADSIAAPAQAFGPEQVITTAASQDGDVHAADLDGDGDPDILSASGTGGTISWYENLGAGAIGPQAVIWSNTGASAVHAADLDGDGDQDVLSAGGSIVAWYENVGGGVFGGQQIIRASSPGASSVVAVDINGDGLTDVLTGSRGEVAWHENLGFGFISIAPQLIDSNASTAFLPDFTSVRAGDLDGDGDQDVVSSNFQGDTIAWYENAGGGTYGPARLISTSADQARSVELADVDGDGDIDVLSASTGDARVAWYPNVGSSFGAEQALPGTTNGANCVHAADFDNDGDVDVLATGTSRIRWFANAGGGSFQNRPAIGLGIPLPTAGYSADIDGDGDADVLCILQNRVVWYENIISTPDCNGNGIPDVDDIAAGYSLDCNANAVPDECELLSGSEVDCNGNSIPDSCEITAGASDCDGNGELDSCELLTGAARDCNGNGIPDGCDISSGWSVDCNENGVPDDCELAMLPDFGAGNQINAAPLGAPWTVADADVDSDGDRDLVVTARSQDSIFWFENNGYGRLEPRGPITTSASGVFSLTVFDADGDGDEDLVTAETSSDTIGLYLNVGGSFVFSQAIDSTLDGARTVSHADIDGDGDDDVVAGSLNDNTIGWYKNLGGGLFDVRRTITNTAIYVLCVDAEDVDGDGDVDVLSASRDDDSVRVFENLGGGTGWTEHLVATVNQPSFVRASDLNGDGQPDVAFTSVEDGTLTISSNEGNLSFGPAEVISNALERASSLAIADLDLDGDLDIATSSYGDGALAGEVAWFRNLGAAGFGIKVEVDSNLNRAASVCAADLDGDGYAELSCAVWLGEQVMVYPNWMYIPRAGDCNANGTPDDCDIASGVELDCDADGTPDACQLTLDPTSDLNANGVLDACESIGSRYCSPAVGNSTGQFAPLTVLGNVVTAINDVQLTARSLPASSFGFFLTSITPGFSPNVPNSEGALCLAGSVGRFVGPGQILTSGPSGSMYLDISLTAHPTPTGLVSIQPGETWNYQLWYRDSVGGQTTSNFTDAVAVTFQ